MSSDGARAIRRAAELERKLSELERKLARAEVEREELNEALRDTLGFQKLAEAVGLSASLEGLLDALVSAVSRVVDFQTLAVYVIDEPGRNPQRVLSRGLQEVQEEALIRHQEDGIVNWALEENRPVSLLPDLSSEYPHSSWILVPLSVLGRSVGYLEILPKLPADRLSTHHLEMLRLAGAQAAAAIDTLRQMELLQGSYSDLRGLYQAASSLGGSLEVHDILEAACTALWDRFRPDFLRIVAFRRGGLETSHVVARGARACETPSPGEALLLSACHLAEPIRAAKGGVSAFGADRDGFDTMVAIPFLHRGSEVLGAVLLAGGKGGTLDTPEAVPWLVALSNLASSALENARLFSDLLRTNDKLAEMQTRLVHAGKLAGVGQLAGGIAHEINNPLQVILGRVQIMQMRSKENSDHLGELARIETETRRIGQIVRGLLDFARQDPGQILPEVLVLAHVVESALELLQHKIRHGCIGVERRGFTMGFRVMGKADELRQLALNLCLNALQAMDGQGGTLSLDIEHVDGWIELRVSDTGPGVPLEVADRIFDPFYTTRHEGTGLGLSLCFGIVQRHEGSLELLPSPRGKGACFRVRLPAIHVDKDGRRTPPLPPPAQPPLSE